MPEAALVGPLNLEEGPVQGQPPGKYCTQGCLRRIAGAGEDLVQGQSLKSAGP